MQIVSHENKKDILINTTVITVICLKKVNIQINLLKSINYIHIFIYKNVSFQLSSVFRSICCYSGEPILLQWAVSCTHSSQSVCDHKMIIKYVNMLVFPGLDVGKLASGAGEKHKRSPDGKETERGLEYVGCGTGQLAQPHSTPCGWDISPAVKTDEDGVWEVGDFQLFPK